MIPTATGLIVIALGIWCQFGDYRRTLMSMVLLTILEAANAADLPALGGASVTPSKFFLAFLVLRIVSMRGGVSALFAEMSPRRVLFVYVLLLVWVVPSGFLLPRLFQGAIEVNSLQRGVIDDGPVLLQPSGGNITQTIYAIGSFTLALCVAALARRPGGYATLLRAFMMLSGMDLGFAVLDLVTAATHTGFILDVIHTGAYAFLTEDEASGLKRISGSFTEASTFATFSLELLSINLALFVMRVRPRLTGFYSLALTFFLLLSTSSTAYAGLAIYGSAFAAYAGWTLLAHGNARALKLLVLLGLAGTFLVSVTVVLAPGFAAAAWNVIDSSVLQKGQSESAIERGALNIQAAKIFFQSYGLGVGIGGTRTSNYIYLLASNIGVIGILLFVALIGALTATRLRGDLEPTDRKMVIAARVAVLASMVPATLIATIFDLGPLFYIFAGIAASGAAPFGAMTPARSRRSVAPTRTRLEA